MPSTRRCGGCARSFVLEVAGSCIDSVSCRWAATWPGVDESKYISVFGLRTHGQLDGLGHATEQIYIHSKAMGSKSMVSRPLHALSLRPWWWMTRRGASVKSIDHLLAESSADSSAATYGAELPVFVRVCST